MTPLNSAKDVLTKAASAATPRQPSVIEEREQQNAGISEAVNKQLPETVPTIYGELSYSDFKTRFSKIYDQVQDKTHLLTGKVTCVFSIGNMSVTMRSLKTRERLALAPLAGSVDGTGAADPRYRTYVLTLAIEKLDTRSFPSVKLTPDTLSTWEQDEQVKAAIDIVENLDESLFLFLFGLFNDLNVAKNLALVENLKNPT